LGGKANACGEGSAGWSVLDGSVKLPSSKQEPNIFCGLSRKVQVSDNGFFKLAGSMLADSIKQEVETSLGLLKRLLEAQG